MALNVKKDFSRTRKPDLTSVVYGKIPPQSIELEEAVIGAIMLEKERLGEVTEIIQSPKCFYVDAHQKIFAAILRVNDNGLPVDLLTVTEELKKSGELEAVGGHYYLTKLTMSVVTSAHVEAHARIIMEKFIQRELIRISGEIISDAYEDHTDVFDLLDKAESHLYDITDKHLRKNFKSLKDVLIQTIDEIEEARNKKDDVTGVPSQFAALDKLTGGWQKTDLIIVAARPAVGKTAFTLNLAMNAALNKDKPYPVAFFSLEMGAGQLVKRMLSAVTEVSMEAITKGRMQDYEFVQLTQRMDKLAKAPIFVDDQAALNIFELRAKARRLKQRHDIQMIIIDYLQLMQASIEKSGNREQEISKISRELKALAKELEIPIIALSQLNRSVESRNNTNKMPQLSDLRESGAIEQDADMVIFLYRPEYYDQQNNEAGETIEGETHLNIAKHRNGSTGVVKVKFIKEYQKFVDLEEQYDGFGMIPMHKAQDRSFGDIDQDESQSSSKLFKRNIKTISSKINNMNYDDQDFEDRQQKPLDPPPFDLDDTPNW